MQIFILLGTGKGCPEKVRVGDAKWVGKVRSG